jgi:hypothetical protein
MAKGRKTGGRRLGSTWQEASARSAARVMDQPVLEGIHGKLETIGQIEFRQDRGQMVPHRGLADKQSFCDRSVLQTLADERDNLVFPARQRRNLLGFGVLNAPPLG